MTQALALLKAELLDIDSRLASIELQPARGCHSCLCWSDSQRKCIKHGPVPEEFLSNNDCPDYDEDDIPF